MANGPPRVSAAPDLLAEMLDEAPSAITVHDFEGRFLYANRRTFELHGYSREEFMALTLEEVDAPESWARMAERLRRIEACGEATFEVEHHRKDGTVLPLEVFVKMVIWGEGAAMLSIANDLTERRRAEEGLRQVERALVRERDTLRATMNSAPVAILVINDAEEVVRANPAAERFLGTWSGQTPHRCGDILRCAHRHGFPEGCGHTDHCPSCDLIGGVRQVLEDGMAICDLEVELTVESPGGTEQRTFIVNIEGLVENGHRSAVAALHEITARRRTEREQAALAMELGQARKMEAIGQLAGGIAHDFNNLITVISTYAELALSAIPEGNPARGDVGQIFLAGRRAAALTEQLLAFSRRQMLSLEAVDCGALLGALAPMLQRLIGETIEVRFDCAVEQSLVMADPRQIELALINLSINSRDAMPEGGVLTLGVSSVHVAEGTEGDHVGIPLADYALLTVADNGIGMDSDTLNRVFDPFFTTKPKGKGTGLGLPSVYGVITQMGGHIRVASEPGQGTTYSLYLPLETASGVEAQTRRPEDLAQRPPEKRETVLLVEDDDDVRVLIDRLLGEAGYAVLSASCAVEALALFETHWAEVGLILTDVVMPDMSGKQLAKHLMERKPSLAVLYMSGYTDEAIVHHGMVDPGIRFVAKPFTVEQLVQKIREALGG